MFTFCNILTGLVQNLLASAISRSFGRLKGIDAEVQFRNPRDPMAWSHDEVLELDGSPVGCPHTDVEGYGGTIIGHRMQLSNFGLSAKIGRAYKVTLTNNSQKALEVKDVQLGIRKVGEAPKGSLIIQEGQSVIDEYEFLIEIPEATEGRIFPAYVPGGSTGKHLYREKQNLYLKPGEVANFTFQISAPSGIYIDFDLVFKFGHSRKYKVELPKDLRLVMPPVEPRKIYTIGKARGYEEENRMVYIPVTSVSEARSKMFSSYDLKQ